MAARDDVLRELRMVPGRLADHVGSDLDPMAAPQIEQARNAFPIAIGEPGVGDGVVGWHTGRGIHLGERAVGALRGLPTASNCIEIEITSRPAFMADLGRQRTVRHG
jgi:hypothetical protein